MTEGSSSASSSTYYQYKSPFGDTTLTKVFVGGLAWETQTEKMHEYFEHFGEILESVIIADKHTRKSKGYGFVTFGDPESAKRAVVDANPMIDGRRANVNIASATRPRHSPSRGRGQGQGGQVYNPGASYSLVQGPLVTPPVPSSIPLMHPSYRYASYNPTYGYNQAAATAMYNQQLQQAHYYQQLYGLASANLQPPNHPNYYGYTMHAAAAARALAVAGSVVAGGAITSYPTMPIQLIRHSRGPYIYYSSPSPFNQSPTGLFNPQLQQQQQPLVSSDSRHQQLPSQLDSHEPLLAASPDPEAIVVTSESPLNN